MKIEERVRLCRLIEKMNKHKAYAKSIGAVDASKFQRRNIGVRWIAGGENGIYGKQSSGS